MTTPAPASAVMRLALGSPGAAWIAFGIMISAAGYLSRATLTTPRLYYAVAKDGLFFEKVAWLHPKTRVPVAALTGRFEAILRYVMSVEMLFTLLTVFSVSSFGGATVKPT